MEGVGRARPGSIVRKTESGCGTTQRFRAQVAARALYRRSNGMPRRFIRRDNWEYGGQPAPAEGTSGEPKSRKRRLATTLVFTTLFFAGASLAAVAGNQFGPLTAEDSQQLAGDTTTTDATATPAAVDASAAPVDAGAGPADAGTD